MIQKSSLPENLRSVSMVLTPDSAHKGHAFFAYAANDLIDTDHGVIVDVEATRAIRQAEVGPARTVLRSSPTPDLDHRLTIPGAPCGADVACSAACPGQSRPITDPITRTAPTTIIPPNRSPRTAQPNSTATTGFTKV